MVSKTTGALLATAGALGGAYYFGVFGGSKDKKKRPTTIGGGRGNPSPGGKPRDGTGRDKSSPVNFNLPKDPFGGPSFTKKQARTSGGGGGGSTTADTDGVAAPSGNLPAGLGFDKEALDVAQQELGTLDPSKIEYTEPSDADKPKGDVPGGFQNTAIPTPRARKQGGDETAEEFSLKEQAGLKSGVASSFDTGGFDI